MNENIQALLQKIAESEELQGQFEKVSTPEEAYEAAKKIQGGFTKEEFLEAAKALAEAVNEDISDEDLASAAGGTDEPEKYVVAAKEVSANDVCKMTNVSQSDAGGVLASASVSVPKSIVVRPVSKATKALTI